MKVGIIFAMIEEFNSFVETYKTNHKEEITILANQNNSVYPLFTITVDINKQKKQFICIISGIGKAASASATTVLIENHTCDIIVNVGTCGGVNQAKIGGVIVANKAGYHDADARAFGYKLGQIPQQPEYFVSNDEIIDFHGIISNLQNKYNVVEGFVITGDSFVGDRQKVEEIKTIYSNTIAVDMEAASIAQICNTYKKEFIFIKKVSDLADADAAESFKTEVNKTAENTGIILLEVLTLLSK